MAYTEWNTDKVIIILDVSLIRETLPFSLLYFGSLTTKMGLPSTLSFFKQSLLCINVYESSLPEIIFLLSYKRTFSLSLGLSLASWILKTEDRNLQEIKQQADQLLDNFHLKLAISLIFACANGMRWERSAMCGDKKTKQQWAIISLPESSNFLLWIQIKVMCTYKGKIVTVLYKKRGI